MIFLFLLRVIVIFSTGMLSYKGKVIYLQVYIDVSTLFEVEGIILAMLWSYPHFGI
jgi:hypothetical protein